MFRVLNETPPERLEAALAPLLDIDGALKFLALDDALVNSDGYWTRASAWTRGSSTATRRSEPASAAPRAACGASSSGVAVFF
jgi:hypothetical protein